MQDGPGSTRGSVSIIPDSPNGETVESENSVNRSHLLEDEEEEEESDEEILTEEEEARYLKLLDSSR